MLFGSLWNPSIFDGINQMKDKKKKKIYMFSYLMNQQLNKKTAGHPNYARIKL